MNVLVIGGTKGLGKGIVEKARDLEHTVVHLSRSTTPSLDLNSDPDNIKAVIRGYLHATKVFPDIVVVSSGMGSFLNPLPSQDKLLKMLNTNMVGPLSVFHAVEKVLLKTKGKIIFITSTTARRPGSGGLSVYGATKAGINGFVVGEGRRMAKAGVAMCSVAPGWFNSEMTEELIPEVRAAATKAIPFGRFGEIDEIAQFIVSLFNQSNWCLAGQIYEVSGGG